jgi:hypothetical protein
MRTLGFGLVLPGTVLALSFGCGESTGGAGANGGGAGFGAAAAGSGNSSAGTAAGKAGANATAGATSGGTSSGGNGSGGTVTGGGVSGSAATTGGQADPQAGAGNEAGGGSALVDCDPKKILCKSLARECSVGEVPSVDGLCYGECVKISRCRCAAAGECPEPDQYTCWAKQHCGPFVQ